MTRSNLDYKPKHKKPDNWAGSTPKGPHRWARAAANAMTHPRSEGAKLYRARVENAAWYLDNYEEDATRPIEFRSSSPSPYVDGKRLYSVCGVYCAVMQTQLEYATLDRDEVDAVFMGSWTRTYERTFNGVDRSWTREQDIFVKVLDRKTLTRVVNCRCCGASIKPRKR